MIFQNAVWKFSDQNQEQIEHYSRLFKQDPLITKLLLDRGFTTVEEVEAFLNPDISRLRDPFLLDDMDQAVTRIRKAIDNKESIWIYGDYDVDGITSISILSKYFQSIGVETHFYIPDRHDEGYGISFVGVDSIIEQGAKLLITVDCGITAIEQVQYAQDHGLDVIVTDHHEFEGELPNAVAVINPKRGNYPFKFLAGCGVALKLVQAISGEQFSECVNDLIDLAALGTVADIVPLIDENRIITSVGLKQMEQTNNLGIRALLSEAQLIGKEINPGHIGFVIAPRINASGRIGNPSISVKMLLESNESNAQTTARDLSQLNADRQSQEKEIMESAEAYIDQQVDLAKEKILLVVGNNWHTGIIGIVASKLSDKYRRPTVILNSDGVHAKGSARSVDGISIYEVLSHFKHLYEKFGGHEQAAGLSLPAENIPLLKQGLMAYSKEHIRQYMLISKERADGMLKPSSVTHELVERIEQLKPFGIGNPKPQFVFTDLFVEDCKVIGKIQNHFKLVVNDGSRVYDALAFNHAEYAKFVRKNEKVNLLITLEKNNFMGVETVQFMIKDMIKERMPLSNTVDDAIQNAIYQYLIQSKPLDENVKFTNSDSFDIIFSVPQKNLLLIFSLSDLMKFRDYVLAMNITHYTVHYNQINPLESRQGYVDVIFMPIDFDGDRAYTVGQTTSKIELKEYIPDRNDLAYYYKLIQNKSQLNRSECTLKGQFSLAKSKICLRLLSDMNLCQYEECCGKILLTWLPKPDQKVDLDQIDFYKNMTTNWK